MSVEDVKKTESQCCAIERRSLERKLYDDAYNAYLEGKIPEPELSPHIVMGVKRRISEILGDDQLSEPEHFSLSAAPYLDEETGNIERLKGMVTIENNRDRYGRALSYLNQDGKPDHELVHPSDLLLLKKTSVILHAKKPVSVEHVGELYDQDKLGFEYLPTKIMAVCTPKPKKSNPKANDYDWKMNFVPTSEVVFGTTANNYGQGVFDGYVGIKRNDGTFALLGMNQHTDRFGEHCERTSMPVPPSKLYKDVGNELFLANIEYLVPGARLYFRPVECALASQIGVKKNKKYIFTCEVIPIATIFKEPLSIKVEEQFRRAAVNGVGWIKIFGNYAPTFTVKEQAESEKCNDVLYLSNERFIRELSSSNIYLITKPKCEGEKPRLIRPKPHIKSGEILDGVTSQLIEQIGIELTERGILGGVESREILLDELNEMDEAFACGTGVGMNGIKMFKLGKDRIEMKIEDQKNSRPLGRFSRIINERMDQILYQEDVFDPKNRYHGWLMKV